MRSFSNEGRGLSRRVVVLALVSALIAGSLVAGAGSAWAGTCDQSTLKPELRATTVNQGLGSYAPLVAGKETLFRAYLSLPQCATASKSPQQSISVKSAALTVRNGASAVTLTPTNSLSPSPLIAPFDQAPANDHTADPLFVIPGTAVTSGTLSLEFSFRYVATSGRTNFPEATFTAPTLPATVNAPTKGMRILAIPMGDPTLTKNVTVPQFSTNAKNELVEGLGALSRMFPVASGVSDLAAGAATGVRYQLNTDALLDVSAHMNQGVAGQLKFCGSGSSFGGIQQTLSAYRDEHNLANATANWVDSAVGVVDEAISASCMEGYASLVSPYSWIRSGSANDWTGALLAMETAHNYGAVPASRSGSGHSTTTTGDDAAPNRGYNVSARAFLGSTGVFGDDKSALRLFAPWHNNNTILQDPDWDLIFCKLGGPSNSECDSTPTEGAPSGAAAQQVDTFSGSTDGTAGGTEVFSSSSGLSGPAYSASDSSSPLKYVQRATNGQILATFGVPLRSVVSTHEHVNGDNHLHVSADKNFAFSFPSNPLATRIELWNGTVGVGEPVFARARTTAPQILSFTIDENPDGIPDDPKVLTGEGGFGDEASRINFDGVAAGTEVTGQFDGVAFDNVGSEPTIVGPCVPGTPPCRFATATTSSAPNSLWNAPPSALPFKGPIDAIPGSAGEPLTINFEDPVQKVGMYIGNNDVSAGGTATLIARDEDGEVIFATPATTFTTDVQTFLGIDAGEGTIASVDLNYSGDLGEEIDDLIFEEAEEELPGEPGGTHTATIKAKLSIPENGRLNLYTQCDGARRVVDVSVPPDATSSGDGTATWRQPIDTRRTCSTGGNATLQARVGDGFLTSDFSSASTAANAGDPQSVIWQPTDNLRVLQHQDIPLSGQGWHPRYGALQGDNNAATAQKNEWFFDGVSQGLGNRDLEPPTGGWTPGTHTVKLVVTDPDGKVAEDTTTITVLADADNDGVSPEPCGSDTDPFDAFEDPDGDGFPSHDDPAPCVAGPEFNASIDLDPDEMNVDSSGNPITAFVRVPLRDLRQVPRTSVKITHIEGQPLAAPLVAYDWKFSGTFGSNQVGVAKFERSPAFNVLIAQYVGKTITVGFSGTATNWSFTGNGFTFVKQG